MASCFKALCLLLAVSAGLQSVLAHPVNEKTKVNNRSSMGMIAQQEGVTNINSNSKTEKINMGTRKTTNYNFAPSHYKPTQTTQVILNVPPHPEPAPPKTTRRTRPPTEEEVEIKEKILELFERAMNEKDNELHKAHLGKVLEALNPKYIATQRVRRVVFSDPKQFSDLQKVASSNESVEDETVAESEPEPTAEQLQNELNDKVQAQLNDLVQRFAQEIQFTPEFLDKLHRADENLLTPHQLAFKHIILCVTDPSSCNSDMFCSGKQQEQEQQQPEEQQQQQQLEQEQQQGLDEQSEQASSVDQYQEDGQHVEQPAEYAGEYQQYPEEDQYQYNQNADEFPQQYDAGRQYDKSEYRTPAQDLEHYSPARDSFSPPHYTNNPYGLEKSVYSRRPTISSTKTEDGSYHDELNQPDGLPRTESERSFGYLPEKVYHDYSQPQSEQQRPKSIGQNWAADARRGQPVEEEQESEGSVDSIRYGVRQEARPLAASRVGPPAQQRPLASRTQIPGVVPRPESRTSSRSQEAPMPRAVETAQLQRPAQAVPKPVNSFTNQQHQPRNQAKAIADSLAAAARGAASQRQGPLRGLKTSLPTPKTQTTKPASSSSTILPGFLNGAPVPQKSIQGQRPATTSQTNPGSTGSESVNTSTARV